MKNLCVYILASRHLGTLYIGVTSDLIARLYQHRTGFCDGFTARYAVWSDLAVALGLEPLTERPRRDGC